MKFRQKIALLMFFAAIQFPCASQAAEEDAELAQIAAAQQREDEQLGEINSALTDIINTKPTHETDREIKERKKKLKQTRKEKEKINERKLKESKKQDTTHDEETIIIDPNEPEQPPIVQTPQTKVTTPPVTEPIAQSQITTPPVTEPVTQPTVTQAANSEFMPTPPPIETIDLPDQKVVYSNFVEVAQAMHFVPLYMTRKSGYDIVGIVASQGIVEIRYGRRWEPTVGLAVRTYKRAPGEEPQDISGVEGVRWRVDTTTGTTIYIAKISDNEQVAAWAVGQYTFSAHAVNMSFAGFHSLIADELIELSTHYYIDFEGAAS